MSGGEDDCAPESDVHRVHHDWHADAELSTTIVEAVAAVTNTPPPHLTPLYERIDPDALNRLFHPPHDGALRQARGSLTLSVNGCRVTVYWDGTIEIRPPEA